MRRAVAVVLVLGLAGVVAVVVHVRRDVVPPGCRDPHVLAIVRRRLIGRDGLAQTVRMENIRVRAGGPLAFRFLCTADLAGLAHTVLPPGPRPGSVRYTTERRGPDRHLVVRVRLQPLLELIPVR